MSTRSLNDHYIDVLNNAVEQDREDLLADLTASYAAETERPADAPARPARLRGAGARSLRWLNRYTLETYNPVSNPHAREGARDLVSSDR